MLSPRKTEIEEHLEVNKTHPRTSDVLNWVYQTLNRRIEHCQVVYLIFLDLYGKGHLEGEKEDSSLGFGEGLYHQGWGLFE